jgi:hypothetical protein
MSKELLSTYLNDHLAGANLAIENLDHLIAETAVRKIRCPHWERK